MVRATNRIPDEGFRRLFPTLILGLFLGLTLWLLLRYSYPTRYRDEVEKWSREYGVDRFLVYAVIRVESRFDPRACSPVGALGLMQIMPDTGRWVASKIGIPFEESMLLDPSTNIRLGVFYLRLLLDEFDGHVLAALAAYNGGMHNVKRWTSNRDYRSITPETIPFTETRAFVARVLMAKRIYEFLYGGALWLGHG